MTQHVTLEAADGHRFDAWTAGVPDAPRALVVVQEIFGVNHHIRNVVEGFATAGFRVVAPALFDRAERGVELAYDEAGMKKGLELRAAIPEAGTLADLEASAAFVSGHARVGVIGYCWGGTLAFLCATRSSRFAAAVGWYGGGIAKVAHETPRCPVQLHFGAEDHSIPATDIETIRKARPEIECFVYEGAGHGFGCDERASYDAKSAALAQERSLAFLTRHL